jgi:hypothetical protein
VLLEVAGSFKTHPPWLTQTVQTPYSATSAVLSSVMMGKNNKAFTFATPFEIKGFPVSLAMLEGLHYSVLILFPVADKF